jgi:hypothetical protein
LSKLNLDNILEKYEELGPGYKTEKYLKNVDQEDIRDAVDFFRWELKELGESWRDGPYGPSVFKELGLNYDKMEEMLDKVVHRNLEECKEEFNFREFISNPLMFIEKGKKAVPNDTVKWTAKYLKNCNFEKVSLDKWVQADLLMKWNFKAKMNEKMSGQLQRLSNLIGS